MNRRDFLKRFISAAPVIAIATFTYRASTSRPYSGDLYVDQKHEVTGDTFYYLIDGAEWEAGIGMFTDGTLSRNTVLAA